ncbi:unnamed protein product [Heterobilharzia americana]|nr:unnamed protein product [Heterobilharzia americana]
MHFFKNRLQFVERSRNSIFNEVELVPQVQLNLSAEDELLKSINLSLKTSEFIVNRLLMTSSEFAASGWYYQENDFTVWRQEIRK